MNDNDEKDGYRSEGLSGNYGYQINDKFTFRYEIALKKEDRIRLKELVVGEDGKNIVPVNVRDDQFVNDIVLTEPNIVVEVAYSDISSRMTIALPSQFIPGTASGRPKLYRILDAKRYITKMVGAKVIRIDEDLNPLKQTDVSFDQDIGLSIKKCDFLSRYWISRYKKKNFIFSEDI